MRGSARSIHGPPRPGRGGADTAGASGAPRPPCHALGAHRPGLPAQVAVTLQEAFASPRELGAARTGVPQTSELLSSPWSHPCAGDKARTADPTEGLGHQAARRRLMSCSGALAPGADASQPDVPRPRPASVHEGPAEPGLAPRPALPAPPCGDPGLSGEAGCGRPEVTVPVSGAAGQRSRPRPLHLASDTGEEP